MVPVVIDPMYELSGYTRDHAHPMTDWDSLPAEGRRSFSTNRSQLAVESDAI